MQFKRCPRCHALKFVSEFGKDSDNTDGYFSWCRECRNKRQRELRHLRKVNIPMTKNKTCPVFLGVHVAERVLSRIFNNVEVMPYGTPGFDFICRKGYKIDVKSSCKIKNGTAIRWKFYIRNNKTPDYFLLIAFDNRDDLNPEHVWLIPGNVLNTKTGVTISSSTLDKWKQYEKPIDDVLICCNKLKATS